MFIKKTVKISKLSDCQAVDRHTNKYQHLNINKIINKLFVQKEFLREPAYWYISNERLVMSAYVMYMDIKYVNVGRIAATKSMLIKG